jgi:gas vesicle protein
MPQFIGGLVIGTIAATFAMALVADRQADPKEQRIRELMTANKVLEAEYETAKQRVDYWQRQYWKVRSGQQTNEASEAETCV